MKVGIPRALLFYEFFPLWKTFFEELGAEVVISPPSSRETVERGLKMVLSEICFPVKVFCGHLPHLSGCDFIFVPSLKSLEEGVYSCPKFIGLPDLVRAVYPSSPPLIDPEIDVSLGRRALWEAVYRMGRPLTKNPLKIRRAIRMALLSHSEYRRRMVEEGLTPPEVLFGEERRREGGMKIALLGHPYLLYDEEVNRGLLGHLEGMGASLLFPENVPEEEIRRALEKIVGRAYWSFEGEIIGAGGYYLERKDVGGIIILEAFGCGPDSLMVDMLRRYGRRIGKPVLTLVLDEHTTEAGIITRLEAFVDMIRMGRRRSFLIKRGEEGKGRTRILGIPSIANLGCAFKKSAEILGITLLTPPITKKTLDLGVKYSPESVCLPFKMILGTFIECLEMGADTLFMVTSFNACRMGYYAKLQEEILRDLGYKFKFLKYSSSRKDLLSVLSAVKEYTNNSPWGKVIKAYRLGTFKLRILDELERKLGLLRGRVRDKTRLEELAREMRGKIEEAEEISEAKRIKEFYFGEMESLPLEDEEPLRVGIIGELFVVMEPFSNMDLERELGKMGCEVKRTRTTFFSEWVSPLSYLNVLDREKERLKRYASPYMRHDVGGHGLESVGEKVRLSGKMDGLIHLAPFTCMPEAIAHNIMMRTREDIPVLTIYCDEELAKSSLITRLEAFVDLLRWRRNVSCDTR